MHRRYIVLLGRPLPEIKWAKKGSGLPYDRLEYDNYGKTIKIKDVDFSDEGEKKNIDVLL